jgi:hypothetical protein
MCQHSRRLQDSLRFMTREAAGRGDFPDSPALEKHRLDELVAELLGDREQGTVRETPAGVRLQLRFGGYRATEGFRPAQ